MTRLIAALAACLIAGPAAAHSWYSLACCSGRDCHPLPAGSVEASPAGWRLKATGEVVPYGDKREQDSQDSDFHVCRFGPLAPPDKAGTIRCLYTPAAGM